MENVSVGEVANTFFFFRRNSKVAPLGKLDNFYFLKNIKLKSLKRLSSHSPRSSLFISRERGADIVMVVAYQCRSVYVAYDFFFLANFFSAFGARIVNFNLKKQKKVGRKLKKKKIINSQTSGSQHGHTNATAVSPP